ncbi:2Fe-2S iron-sulfur cluster-binding protein [Colibacter massiliensis]|uniref:2Fe-2S iron-sulfur cluster-binding protein n=1 Tax=Colibacter massiliensis TaxID=1852379 RepID=UPI00094E0D9B|nr:2Fe-2S iron-sulfur cluster-binding protein [Colibacter massiliensis]
MITLYIKRQRSAAGKAYTETFTYDGADTITVADFLTQLNKNGNRRTIDGKRTEPVAWECGCLEGKCGSCAMVINGMPRLACRAFLRDTAKNGKIYIEPLSKFPLIKDLSVDRQDVFDTLRKRKIWTNTAVIKENKETRHLIYTAGQCLECGCCLEVCPNFKGQFLKEKQREKAFPGPLFVSETYRAARTSGDADHIKDLKKQYKSLFYNTCDNSLACRDVCPAKLDLGEMQARLNKKGDS